MEYFIIRSVENIPQELGLLNSKKLVHIYINILTYINIYLNVYIFIYNTILILKIKKTNNHASKIYPRDMLLRYSK